MNLKDQSKTLVVLRQSRPREKQDIGFSPRATRSKSNKNIETDNNLKSTRSTSGKRTQPEDLNSDHLNKKSKNNHCE